MGQRLIQPKQELHALAFGFELFFSVAAVYGAVETRVGLEEGGSFQSRRGRITPHSQDVANSKVPLPRFRLPVGIRYYNHLRIVVALACPVLREDCL